MTSSRSTRVVHTLLAALMVAIASGALSTVRPAQVAAAGTFYVSTSGSDSTGTGSQSKPWKTIQKAADTIGPGSTVLVQPGTYRDGVYISIEATASAPVVFRGNGAGVVIDADGVDRDAVYIESSSYVTWENIRVQDAPRAGLRISASHHVTVRDSVFANNQRWGIFTDFSDDLLIEGNEAFGATIEHGIYHSNSGDRPTIRGNVIHDNHANGIHMNGDVSMGGDGVISSAVVEGNYIYNNGSGGGSGINMDGVQSSLVRNNVIVNNHASGISMYQIDGGICSRNNRIYHNTVVVAADGRWAINIPNSGCTGNDLKSNILYSNHSYRGAINLHPGAEAGFESDYNVLEGVFTMNDGDTTLSLTQWRNRGHDIHSKTSTPSALFVNITSNFRLKSGSPAIDAGLTLTSVKRDFDNKVRPQGSSSDAGAFEAAAVKADCTLSPTSGVVYTQITVTCTGFKPGENITLRWDGDTVATGKATSSGKATIRFTAPRDTTGRHLVKATGDDGSTVPSRGFRIQPSIQTSPQGGTVGQTISVTLRGYGAGEMVRVRFRTAPGSSRTVVTLTASSTGTASGTFKVPIGPVCTCSVEGAGEDGGFASVKFTRILGTAEEPTSTPSPSATATVEPTETASPEPTETTTAEPTASETAAPIEPTATETAAPATATPEPTETPAEPAPEVTEPAEAEPTATNGPGSEI
ncbi:MAG: right-handed parallel beta-helix repeat-containing protein [Chloroflexota bacterium]|nr:right-handed parallel beta-helix repeat-containing protein [Chloroflexota bacterium]